MKLNRLITTAGTAISMMTAGALHADQHAVGDPELAARLNGAMFSGIYLRAGTPYTMTFGADGSLVDSAGREGRWWTSEGGQYCREWTSGPMAGVTTCMQMIFHLDRVAIYSGDEKVLEGELIRAQ